MFIYSVIYTSKKKKSNKKNAWFYFVFSVVTRNVVVLKIQICKIKCSLLSAAPVMFNSEL